MKTIFLVSVLPVLQILSCRNNDKFCSSFFNIKQNHRYVGNTIKQTFVGSSLTCSHKCLREKNCVSFNYQTRGEGNKHMCELIGQAAEFGCSDLVYDTSYEYYEMQNKEKYLSAGTGNRKVSAKNCSELKKQGYPDGEYMVDPDGLGTIKVFCDQTTDGGGWTVIQRRFSPFSTSFNRNWAEYQFGFGSTRGEFWLGNDNIHRLTAAAQTELRIDLTASGSHTGFAKYSSFYVGSGHEKYRWNMNGYSGNIGNSLYGFSQLQHNERGMKFSTPDQDNDLNPGGNCAQKTLSGWWKHWCGWADLNKDGSLYWNEWIYKSSIIRSEMKLR